jgi:hypothetical protein
MLSISPAALELIRKRNEPVFLDVPPPVGRGCCLGELQECPSVRFGVPRDASRYEAREIDGVTVYVPRELPSRDPLTLVVQSFLGFRRVVVEGWRLL